ncbi:MAG: hypothetical protein QM619_11110 [Micropruina sp.]|uniref:hypothetical protein n=1 Tax=Micropruina sp. TaxID=2737536 RepID=UPI0039E59E50
MHSEDGAASVGGQRLETELQRLRRHLYDGDLRLGRPIKANDTEVAAEKHRDAGGVVYDVRDFPKFVYKELNRPLVGSAGSFEEIATLGRQLSSRLESRGVEVFWPLDICGDRDVARGYIMERIPDEYHLHVRTPYMKSRRLAEMARALPTGKAFQLVEPITAADRLELVKLVGVFLNELHAQDFVYGDVSWANFLFVRKPTKIGVIDLDSTRRLAGPFIKDKDAVDTLGWRDSLAPADPEPLGFDLDRYRYALLVYRMLVTLDRESVFPEDVVSIAVPRTDGLAESARATLEFVLRRAAAAPYGCRPPICEWLGAYEK